MRREHDSITVDVLDKLAAYLREKGPFHVTALAARANLPHDRLKTYLDELAALGFVEVGLKPAITAKGRQFLECYHAWVRIQKIYGLDPRAGRGQALRFLPGGQPLHLLPTAPPPQAIASGPSAEPIDIEAEADAQESRPVLAAAWQARTPDDHA